MLRAVWGQDLQDDIARALAPALRAIAASMGPEGRHVVHVAGTRVAVAATGVDIARQACSSHFAATALKEALIDAERELGDGTARLAVMAGAALGVMRRRVAGGAVPERVVTALARMRAELDAAFAAETETVTSIADVARSAAVGSEIVDRIAAAVDALGAGGLIEVVDHRTGDDDLCLREGFVFHARPVGADALPAMEQVHLIVVNDVLRDFRTLAPVIDGFAQSGKALLIVARGLEDQALALIERNRCAGILRVAALVPTVAGPKAADVLEDLAVATGAVLVSDHGGSRLEALKPGMLGRAASYRRQGTVVTLAGGAGDPAQIALRLRAIEAEISANRYLQLDREQAQRRHACLAGKWAELRIRIKPGDTRTLREARSAVASIRSASASGGIAGAGQGLCRIADRLQCGTDADPGGATAREMICAALRAPAACLQINAGTVDLPGQVRIVDPAGLSRSILDIALSLAAQLGGIEGSLQRQNASARGAA